MIRTVVVRRSGPSNGARALMNSLRAAGLRVVLSDDGRYRQKSLIINWGSTEQIDSRNKTINSPDVIRVARDKLLTFNTLKDKGFAHIPKFSTTQPSDSERQKDIILERHTLTGQSGSGIVVKRPGTPLSSAPLYVWYIRKTKEFRVHVCGGQAVAVQEKRRESDNEQTEDQKLIRNRDNGWVFCVQEVHEPAGLRDVAVDACAKLGLDMGAVDMIQSKEGQLYVLEVNTKPGLESPTVLDAYVSKIKELVNDG